MTTATAPAQTPHAAPAPASATAAPTRPVVPALNLARAHSATAAPSPAATPTSARVGTIPLPSPAASPASTPRVVAALAETRDEFRVTRKQSICALITALVVALIIRSSNYSAGYAARDEMAEADCMTRLSTETLKFHTMGFQDGLKQAALNRSASPAQLGYDSSDNCDAVVEATQIQHAQQIATARQELAAAQDKLKDACKKGAFKSDDKARICNS